MVFLPRRVELTRRTIQECKNRFEINENQRHIFLIPFHSCLKVIQYENDGFTSSEIIRNEIFKVRRQVNTKKKFLYITISNLLAYLVQILAIKRPDFLKAYAAARPEMFGFPSTCAEGNKRRKERRVGSMVEFIGKFFSNSLYVRYSSVSTGFLRTIGITSACKDLGNYEKLYFRHELWYRLENCLYQVRAFGSEMPGVFPEFSAMLLHKRMNSQTSIQR